MLSERLRALEGTIVALAEWAEKWLPTHTDDLPHEKKDDAHS